MEEAVVLSRRILAWAEEEEEEEEEEEDQALYSIILTGFTQCPRC